MLFVKLNETIGTIEFFFRKDGKIITKTSPIVDYDIVMVVPRDVGKLEEIKKRTKPIKLGLTYKGTDTTTEQSQRHINMHNCHPALVDMYSTREGRMYRAMTTHVELGFTISDFEEEQYHLSQLKEAEFVEFNGEMDELRNYFV